MQAVMFVGNQERKLKTCPNRVHNKIKINSRRLNFFKSEFIYIYIYIYI